MFTNKERFQFIQIHQGEICRFQRIYCKSLLRLLDQQFPLLTGENDVSYLDASPDHKLNLNTPRRGFVHGSKQKCFIQRLCDGSYSCDDIVNIREENLFLQIPEQIGPYISFVHEMRGEILVQLEKYNQHDKGSQEFTARNNGWRVLGWSIKRAKELEKVEKFVVSQDVFEIENLHTQPFVEQEAHSQGLSVTIMGHFDQFFMTCVSPLQKRTQELYGRSMELLYQYLSTRFGKSFEWSMLNEEVLLHFLTVWYLDHNRPTPVASKVFLNTLKKLFMWLTEEKIAEVYPIFRRVYCSLIRLLPITIEARKWMKENGIQPKLHSTDQEKVGIYQLTTSSSSPVVLVDDKWVPIRLNGYPPMWEENSFWVRGSLIENNGNRWFTRIDNVYPVVHLDRSKRMINRS